MRPSAPRGPDACPFVDRLPAEKPRQTYGGDGGPVQQRLAVREDDCREQQSDAGDGEQDKQRAMGGLIEHGPGGVRQDDEAHEAGGGVSFE